MKTKNEQTLEACLIGLIVYMMHGWLSDKMKRCGYHTFDVRDDGKTSLVYDKTYNRIDWSAPMVVSLPDGWERKIRINGMVSAATLTPFEVRDAKTGETLYPCEGRKILDI